MDKLALQDALAPLADLYEQGRLKYESEADAWWQALPYEDKLLAFYSVVKRIHDGDVKQQGSYRYVLYEVFGFGAEAYGIGMDCGYMSLHNAIKTDEENQIIHAYYEEKSKKHVKCKNKDKNGSCPLSNVQCNYPECEKL
jgi:hypothetical protein